LVADVVCYEASGSHPNFVAQSVHLHFCAGMSDIPSYISLTVLVFACIEPGVLQHRMHITEQRREIETKKCRSTTFVHDQITFPRTSASKWGNAFYNWPVGVQTHNLILYFLSYACPCMIIIQVSKPSNCTSPTENTNSLRILS